MGEFHLAINLTSLEEKSMSNLYYEMTAVLTINHIDGKTQVSPYVGRYNFVKRCDKKII